MCGGDDAAASLAPGVGHDQPVCSKSAGLKREKNAKDFVRNASRSYRTSFDLVATPKTTTALKHF
jgi:hypothetical protein